MNFQQLVALRDILGRVRAAFGVPDIDSATGKDFFEEALWALPAAVGAIERVYALKSVDGNDEFVRVEDVVAAIIGGEPDTYDVVRERLAAHMAAANEEPVPQPWVRLLLEHLDNLESQVNDYYRDIPGDDVSPRYDRDEDEIEYFEAGDGSFYG